MIDISITPEHLEKLFNDCGASYSDNAMLLSEEMSELNKEIMKFKRNVMSFHGGETINYYGIGRDKVTEEMAHVYICMEAMKKLIGIRDIDIQKKIDEKEK